MIWIIKIPLLSFIDVYLIHNGDILSKKVSIFLISIPNFCNLVYFKMIYYLHSCCGFVGFYVKGMMLNKESNRTLIFRVMHSCLKEWITLKMAALRYIESSTTTRADTASLPRRNKRWGVQIMKLLSVQSSPVSYSLRPVNANVCSNPRKPSGFLLLVVQKPGGTM